MEARVALRQAAEARRLLVCFSPYAGARSGEQRAGEIGAALESAGFRVQLTSDLRELARLAEQWQQAGELRSVVACGGDGTAAAVRNHTPLDSTLLIVPMGTENLLGNYISQGVSPRQVVDTVESGVTVSLDLGRARGGGREHYFLSMISAGFDAEVVRRFHQRRRGNITRLSYVQPTLEVIRSYRYPELQVYCDGDHSADATPFRCRWVFGFNLPLYARGWRVAPDAVATDGQLDICTFERGSVGNVGRYLWHVIWGSHLRLSDAKLSRSERLRIEAADGSDVAYQIDGDFGGSLPVDVDVLDGGLRLLVMPDVARRLGFQVPQTC